LSNISQHFRRFSLCRPNLPSKLAEGGKTGERRDFVAPSENQPTFYLGNYQGIEENHPCFRQIPGKLVYRLFVLQQMLKWF